MWDVILNLTIKMTKYIFIILLPIIIPAMLIATVFDFVIIQFLKINEKYIQKI